MSRPTAGSSDSSAEAESSGNEFAIVCGCGTPHAGQRRRRHQQILCKECGTALFVLPLDVYPKPSTASKKRGRKSKTRFSIGDLFKASRNRISGSLDSTTATLASSIRSLSALLFSPWKIAVYGVVIAVLATGWFLHHRGEIARAKISVVADADVGNEALREGDYETAEMRLNAAADAVRLLGRSDEASRRIEQAAREATVLANLASTSLLDLLSEIEDAGVDGNLEWKRPQQISMRDQWLAFDASVEQRDGRVAIVLPVRVGNPPSPVFVRVDSQLFDRIPLDSDPKTIIFAGQIGNVRRLTNAWDVIVEPESIFLWESLDLYSPLGFVIDPTWNTADAVAERLIRQREWQGGSELPDDPRVKLESTEGSKSEWDGAVQ